MYCSLEVLLFRPWIRIRNLIFSFLVIPDLYLGPVKMNRNTCRGVMIPAIDPDPESYFQPFRVSRSGFRSSNKWNRNTATVNRR